MRWGIAPAWDGFGDALEAYGIDPKVEEIARLRKRAPKGVVYEEGMMTVEKKYQHMLQGWEEHVMDNFGRTSAGKFVSTLSEQPFSISDRYYTYKELCELHQINDVDFIKLDIDGYDFQLLHAIAEEGFLTKQQVLGVGAEVVFLGNDNPHQNNFRNIDGLLKKHAFQIYDLDIHRYSMSALPHIFAISMPAQTVLGKLYWGDTVYFRDFVQQQQIFKQFSNDKLGKLLCVLYLFNQEDSAAELLVNYPERFAFLGDIEEGLNMLVPANHISAKKTYTYREYIALYQKNPIAFCLPQIDALDVPKNPTFKNLMIEYLRIHPLWRFISKRPFLKHSAQKMLRWLGVLR